MDDNDLTLNLSYNRSITLNDSNDPDNNYFNQKTLETNIFSLTEATQYLSCLKPESFSILNFNIRTQQIVLLNHIRKQKNIGIRKINHGGMKIFLLLNPFSHELSMHGNKQNLKRMTHAHNTFSIS